MRGASAGKTMYVVPYLMAPPGSPLEAFAAGVELTDTRTVVLHMIRMARVGVDHVNDLADQNSFVRAVHVTGDLENLGQGTADDQRYFVTVADERTILHYGSSYGGNALLGKIAHGLRQATYDGWASGKFLAEQFMLLGITDKQTGRTYHICGGMPSASGKTNLAMMLAPDALGDRYTVHFYGDDIAWLWVDPEDGRVYAINPEFGAFGVAKDTNEVTNPTAVDAIAEGTGTIFTNVAYNEQTQDVWWEGKTPEPPADVDGLARLEGRADLRAVRGGPRTPPGRTRTAASPPRWPTCPNIAPDYENPKGVPIDAIIFGGRTRDREPLIRAITDLAEGVYDGLTLGAEATFAAEGTEGVLRYDPMSMRPFMAYSEGAYAAHWLKIIGAAKDQPIFAHVNWFQRGDGRPLPVAGLPRQPAPAAVADAAARTARSPAGRRRSGSCRPRRSSSSRASTTAPGGPRHASSPSTSPAGGRRWRTARSTSRSSTALPEEIWEAHRRVAAALDADAK